MKAVLNGRQLALKITANSVYIFTGAQRGFLPCPEIASSVTGFGREMINQAKGVVEEAYNAKVTYGDTDSVMILFGNKERAKVIQLGREAAARVTRYFNREPISLELENVYSLYLLIGKKRYIGVVWTNEQKSKGIKYKGVDIAKRNTFGLLQEILKSCLDKIMIEDDVDGAKAIVHRYKRSLAQQN